MNGRTEISEILLTVEKIVQVIKDKDLKPVAFGKVLDIYLREKLILNVKHAEDSKNPTPKKKTVKTIKNGPKAWIEELINGGYFKKPTTLDEARTELSNRGHVLKPAMIQPYLNRFVVSKRLRRTKQKHKDSGVSKWHYINW